MKSLNIFMHERLDYAGLYPPTNLTLQESLNNFSNYYFHKQKDWLGNFILPVNKIDETILILTEQNTFQKLNNKACFSIIISNCENISDYSNILENDILLIKKLIRQFENKIIVNSIEFFPPKEIFKSNNSNKIIDILNVLLDKFSSIESINQLFCEIPFIDNMDQYIEKISNFNNNYSNKFAVKLRTGGVTPAQIPPASQIAKAIRICAEHKVPVKATAGLHVPVPNDNRHVGARLHGFLNIFSCFLLCYENLMSIENMEKIILEYSYSNFKFTENGFRIEDHFISNEKMTELRKSFIKSFGTCSFIEPIDHLIENHIL